MTTTFNTRDLPADCPPLTVMVCNDPTIVIEHDAERGPTITAEVTVAQARSWSPERWAALAKSPVFVKMWDMVFGSEPKVPIPERGEGAPLVMLHVAGLAYLSYRCVLLGVTPHIVLPETYMHPKQQANLGSLFTWLTTGGCKLD